MIILLLILVLTLFLYYSLFFKNNTKIPDGVLFFYSMEECPYCVLMENELHLLNDELSKIKIFKITLKKDSSVEYSEDLKDLKSLSLKNKVESYPTLMYLDRVNVGFMKKEELLNFIK